jgi:hypothetical protein
MFYWCLPVSFQHSTQYVDESAECTFSTAKHSSDRPNNRFELYFATKRHTPSHATCQCPVSESMLNHNCALLGRVSHVYRCRLRQAADETAATRSGHDISVSRYNQTTFCSSTCASSATCPAASDIRHELRPRYTRCVEDAMQSFSTHVNGMIGVLLLKDC